MRVEEFDFNLPENLIALRPINPKHHARQLVVNHGEFSEQRVWDFPDHLTSKDLIVFNDTKVIPSYLFAKRGDMITEVNLHKRVSAISWLAFAKKTKRMNVGDVLSFGDGRLSAVVAEKHDGGEILLNFDVDSGTVEHLLAEVGLMPLPPYIASKRDVDDEDIKDYQTMFARRDGAVAAPTASLHFTPELMQKIADLGIRTAHVTLHVGAGTFLPVKVDDTKDHKMHSEWGEVSLDVAKIINETHVNGGRVVAVGTTVLRILESACHHDGHMQYYSGDTSIFITPGYQFKCVDILMSNFHLPKSTLFMLVSAFCGFDTMKKAYQHAINHEFRFYSYGDSCLLFRK
ncbi:MAG: tRNA preQ1(34) S-adenosylmethionine ribosyltransferase-isomerase QueA [Alphaproteobacteria bacterium CG1_02_46_17]|nr:MAG: tRNA preQ1(34) S-adenosylmethionine ribosyltransferase-isomerase QueA [Alphaproteobacteria bacterium CG1_02_46_17]